MATELKQYALTLLRLALANPTADFRDGQWEAIEALLERRARLLVVQRTGWGKSLVYFLATRLIRERGAGPTLLISPLLSLMRNQLVAAQRLGVKAETINSSNTSDWAIVHEKLLANAVDILLISPERLANDQFREDVLLPLAQQIGFFVVDEAHCISDWGHDFRPDYLRIVRVLQALPPTIPVLTTTATANDRVIDDVRSQLGPNIRVIRGPLMRQSLHLQNITLPSQAARMAWLANQVPRLPGSGIIYTLTVRDTYRISDWLQSEGIKAQAYSGDVNSEVRKVREQQLLDNHVKVLVATSALGMGFDKPDLGFVIHFQRPGSVVHYYQQVGRAGRAIPDAYGVLLSGKEDQDIAEYFIQTAFPPEAHVYEVLGALHQADDGMTQGELERSINLTRGQIEKVLKSLAVQSPAPVLKQGSSWYATPVRYVPDRAKIERITEIRYHEQARMMKYIESRECLMRFLARELDDAQQANCGRCAVCMGRPLLPETFASNLAVKAVQFLQRSDQVVKPRKRWPKEIDLPLGWSGNIPAHLQSQHGRALSAWGDDGWGALVRQGKQETKRFDDRLVEAVATMIKDRWRPSPMPTWVVCVPSMNNPNLVPDFALRVAQVLRLPFIPCVRKLRHTRPQKEMQNSYTQVSNIAEAFEVDQQRVRTGAVLLLDDMVDSGWTFTLIGALLRSAGSGPVYPLALAVTSRTSDG